MKETVQADVHKDALVESVTATMAWHKNTSDERPEETTCGVNGVVD